MGSFGSGQNSEALTVFTAENSEKQPKTTIKFCAHCLFIKLIPFTLFSLFSFLNLVKNCSDCPYHSCVLVLCYFSTLVLLVLYQVAAIMLFIPCFLLIWSKVIKEIICSQLHFLEFPEAGNSALQLCLPPILSQINFALTLK